MKSYLTVAIFFVLVAGFILSCTQEDITPQTSTTQVSKQSDDEDNCSIAMCNAFGGGIVGDTLALDFMSGE